MAGFGGMAGVQDTTMKKKKWVPPERQPIQDDNVQTDQTDQFNLGEANPMAMDVMNQMMSGSAFDPYRQMSQEAMGRAEANKRAVAAGKIARSGQVGQGMGGQIAGATEQGILSNRFDQMLNTQMAEQQMKERGVGMYQQGRGLEADIAYKEAGLGLEKERIGEMTAGRESSERMASEELAGRERIAGQQERGTMSRFGRELSSREKMQEKSLEEQRLGRESLENYRGRQLDLVGEELGLKREMFESDSDFRERVQNWKEDYGEKELGLKEQQVETDRLRQLSNAAYQKGQLDLGWGTLDFQKMSFTEKLDLQKDAQKWLEKYQQGTMDLNQLQFELESKYKNWIMEKGDESIEKEKEKEKEEKEKRVGDGRYGYWTWDEQGNRKWEWY